MNRRVIFNTEARFAACFCDGNLDVTTRPGKVQLVDYLVYEAMVWTQGSE